MNLRTISDDFFSIGNAVILHRTTHHTGYDFAFRNHFDCRSVVAATQSPILLHIGPIEDYAAVEAAVSAMGMKLLMNAEEHERCSTIERWYPLLAGKTPYTRVFDSLPPIDALPSECSFPLFIKGNRQTSRHDQAKCIVSSAEEYEALRRAWAADIILSWQKPAIRAFVPLQPVDAAPYPNQVPISFEFRFFFFDRQCMGYGAYWHTDPPYTLPICDQDEALSLAQWAADRVGVPFIAVDLAKTRSGEWIIIEVNDAQESGFVGVNPIRLWKNTVAAMQSRG